ncbi:hypothetical protein NDU88_002004 [Pleurodeles waltl]|uniref:Uncharacterized protein n=1 Tax=Pleurodeles waltl TaxID=8319 RepID=A0AAV7WK59_PLEWA|nr:hypothetical protein NDU88_002004 [Pleurodeles waltl]
MSEPPTIAEFPTRAETASRRDPVAWQRILERNDLQRGQSRVTSALRPALLKMRGTQFGRPRGASRCSGPPAS